MSIQQISFSTFHELYNHLDESIFSSYFAHLEENNPKEANQLLFELYDDGYDLSDILFFLYNYVKEHSKYNYAIEVLCDYMNEYYNGHNHQVFILFLTLDIQNKNHNVVMSANQIIQTNVSNFHFVTYFAVENDTLIYNLEVFKKLMYEGKIPEFLEELKEFYYKNKHYYLSRSPITFNNFNTIMRQIMNKNEVPYERRSNTQCQNTK